MVDYSKLSTKDLLALKSGDYSKVSTEGLLNLKNIQDNTATSEQKKGIDITPGGILKQGARAFATPIRMGLKNESLKQAWQETGQGLKKLEKEHPILMNSGPVVADVWGYSQLPFLKAAKGANLARKIGTTAGNIVIQGAVPGALEGLKKDNPLGGAAMGSAISAGMQGIARLGKPINGLIQKGLNNPNFQNSVTGALEVLTSVPQKYSKLALQKELAGQSIFDKAFNPDTAYQGVERKIRLAKDVLPSKEYFAKQFYSLGQKAKEGIEAFKNKEGQKLAEAIEQMDDKIIENSNVQKAVNGVIDEYGTGGVYNSAIEEAPQVVNYLNKNLAKEGLTHRDLDRIKNRLYDMGYAASQNREGTAAEVARGAAEQINNYLRTKNPLCRQPNDRLSLMHDLERDLGGINSATIGKKLQNYGDPQNLIGGVDMKLNNIDEALPSDYQFIDETKKLIEEQNEVNNIQKLIGNKFLRNPKLLANVKDEATEQALEELQKKSNINFMNELQETRARDILEKIAPGQGGGSGSEEGFFNNVVRPTINTAGRGLGGAIIGSQLGGPVGATIGLMSVSPKIMAKGTIQNLGKLYRGLKNPEDVNHLTPLIIKGGVPLLQGKVEYNQ